MPINFPYHVRMTAWGNRSLVPTAFRGTITARTCRMRCSKSSWRATKKTWSLWRTKAPSEIATAEYISLHHRPWRHNNTHKVKDAESISKTTDVGKPKQLKAIGLVEEGVQVKKKNCGGFDRKKLNDVATRVKAMQMQAVKVTTDLTVKATKGSRIWPAPRYVWNHLPQIQWFCSDGVCRDCPKWKKLVVIFIQQMVGRSTCSWILNMLTLVSFLGGHSRAFPE